MKSVDCRGLACPGPVLKSKKAIEAGNLNELIVLVDNEAAKQNVSRFLESQNFQVTEKEEGDNFHITGIKKDGEAFEIPVAKEPVAERQKIMVMVANDCMGHGDDELAEKLMVSFLKTLKEMGEELWRLVFVNNGVKLTIDDSVVLSDLKMIEDQGTHILVCGTCLNHFDLMEKKQIGETTNMLDIVTAMQLADKVISI